MILKECLFNSNGAYKAAQRIKPMGIVVHSTGCDNEMLRRYVQPDTANAERKTILEDLGKNMYNNHHNQEYINGVYNDICMHAYIGCNDKGTVEVYHTLPYNFACWGCGRGSRVVIIMLLILIYNSKYVKIAWITGHILTRFLTPQSNTAHIFAKSLT